jgi:hypothetical protein
LIIFFRTAPSENQRLLMAIKVVFYFTEQLLLLFDVILSSKGRLNAGKRVAAAESDLATAMTVAMARD